jgi:cell wall-associated NlpC family hydrolase
MYIKFSLLLLIVLFLSSCSLVRKNTSVTYLGTFSPQETEEIIQSSKQFIGIPYRNGGTDLNGMDCSGFLFSLYAGNSFMIPRTTGQQLEYGYLIDKSNIQIGDWLFFKTNGALHINHVGLVTEINLQRVLFIHASTSKGIREDDLYQNYWAQSFVKAIRPFKR